MPVHELVEQAVHQRGHTVPEQAVVRPPGQRVVHVHPIVRAHGDQRVRQHEGGNPAERQLHTGPVQTREASRVAGEEHVGRMHGRLGPLARFDRVLHRQWVKAELCSERVQKGAIGLEQVEPDQHTGSGQPLVQLGQRKVGCDLDAVPPGAAVATGHWISIAPAPHPAT